MCVLGLFPLKLRIVNLHQVLTGTVAVATFPVTKWVGKYLSVHSTFAFGQT